MLTTGKISEGNQTCTLTATSSAKSGTARTSLATFMKGAETSTDVVSHMGGKNKSTIQTISKRILAREVTHATNLIVHTSTTKQTDEKTPLLISE
jgi:hypothetical protein